MQIITTTTLDISEENLGLLPVVSNEVGYEQWKSLKINNAKQEARNATPIEDLPTFTFDETTVDTTTDTFIKEFLAKDSKLRLVNIIKPAVDKYFGIVMAAQANTVKVQLDGAITSVVTITE